MKNKNEIVFGKEYETFFTENYIKKISKKIILYVTLIMILVFFIRMICILIKRVIVICLNV